MYKYSYTPLENVEEIIDEVVKEFGLTSEGDGSKFKDLGQKSKVLTTLGIKLQHYIPSSKLHYIECIEDVKEFYSQPVQNITEYSKLARDEDAPENLAVRENPVRFHPCDREAVHRGLVYNVILIE